MTPPGSDDFFKRAKATQISMPAVVPAEDAELEQQDAPAPAPAQAPVQDSFDEEPDELTVLAAPSDEPPPDADFGVETEPPPGLELGHESDGGGGLELGHDATPPANDDAS